MSQTSFEPPPTFGSAMREAEFDLDPEVTYLNHGSYGVVPRRVNEVHKARSAEMEKNPDLFIRRSIENYWREATERVAKLVGGKSTNITFTENTTTAINNVLRSVAFNCGDAILYNNLTYPAMMNTVEHIANTIPGVVCLKIQHSLPISNSDDVVKQYRDILDAHPNVKLALIDHIASFGLRFPVQALVDLCKSRGVLALVDGGHCPGHVHLNLEQMAPDFYIGNIHKWAFAPRGCALQWVAPQHHSLIKPAVVSIDMDKPYPAAFFRQGTRDDTQYASIPAAIDFLEWIGGIDAQHAYAEELWRVGLPLLTEAWGTAVADAPDDMQAPFMRLVRLPPLKDYPPVPTSIRPVLNVLYDNFKIWCHLMCNENQLYLRISVNIYVCVEDFEKLKNAIRTFMA